MLDESFKNKLRWQVYNKNFKSIKKFEYSYFTFKFLLDSQKQQEEFTEFVCSKDDLMPWELGNFFIQQNIKFKIRFRYLKNFSLKRNSIMYRTVKNIQWQLYKIYIKQFINNYKFDIELNRKEINKKIRLNFMLQFLNIKKRVIYYIQADSNIWWKPKIIRNKNSDFEGVSIGWLFAQIGKAKFK